MRTIQIKGMICWHCAREVAKSLSEIHGISNVKVDLRKGAVCFDEREPVDSELFRQRIAEMGYTVG
jgi:copper chaperone CopZ